MRPPLPRSVAIEHRVTPPQTVINGEEASGRWYLQDRVIAPASNRVIIGAGFHRDSYRKTADACKISATGYDRTCEMNIGLEGCEFDLTFGAATAPDQSR